jgi:hypothetical protein
VVFQSTVYVRLPTACSYLRAEAQEQEVDRVSFKVFRKISDGRPLSLDTQLELSVSGKAREVQLGKILPESALPVQLVSSLPARLSEDGVLRIQLRPGTHTVQIASVFAGAVGAIERVAVPVDGWPSEEVWVWEPNEEFGLLRLKGLLLSTRLSVEYRIIGSI